MSTANRDVEALNHTISGPSNIRSVNLKYVSSTADLGAYDAESSAVEIQQPAVPACTLNFARQDGGNRLTPGDQPNIEWGGTTLSAAQKVNIVLWQTAGSRGTGQAQVIATDLSNDGVFIGWTVPLIGLAGEFEIRVYDPENYNLVNETDCVTISPTFSIQ